MKQLKRIAAAALAAAALTATLGAAGASATTLEVGGVAKNEAVTLTLSLKSGTSANLRDTFGFSANTCTGSHKHGSLVNPFGAAFIYLPLTLGESGLSFTGCSDPVTVHKTGTLVISHTAGTNGTASSSGAEWTTDGPFGYLNCVTGAGTHLGTLTGVKEGHATLDINATLDCGISAKLIATYVVTAPTGLGVVS